MPKKIVVKSSNYEGSAKFEKNRDQDPNAGMFNEKEVIARAKLNARKAMQKKRPVEPLTVPKKCQLFAEVYSRTYRESCKLRLDKSGAVARSLTAEELNYLIQLAGKRGKNLGELGIPFNEKKLLADALKLGYYKKAYYDACLAGYEKAFNSSFQVHSDEGCEVKIGNDFTDINEFKKTYLADNFANSVLELDNLAPIPLLTFDYNADHRSLAPFVNHQEPPVTPSSPEVESFGEFILKLGL